MEKINEKCEIFGVYCKELDVTHLSFFGLFALQYRGQESSGITVGDGESLSTFRCMGLVYNIYTKNGSL